MERGICEMEVEVSDREAEVMDGVKSDLAVLEARAGLEAEMEDGHKMNLCREGRFPRAPCRIILVEGDSYTTFCGFFYNRCIDWGYGRSAHCPKSCLAL